MLSEPIINSLPTEMLGEIFVRCLPDYPLEVHQPDPTIAPILLCHVCSLWRTIVFGTPSLWSCLYVLLPIRRVDTKHGTKTWDPERLLELVEFMEWWRAWQGPGLGTTSIRIEFPREQDALAKPVTADVIRRIAWCISSAKYIDIAYGFYYRLIMEPTGTRPCDIPILEPDILIVDCGETDERVWDHVALTHLPKTVRRLSILRGGWISRGLSLLSHLSLRATVDSGDWHALIRGLLNIQWGDFNVTISDPMRKATHHTLPFLTTLRINFDNVYDWEATDAPWALLFDNIHLPVLNDLTVLSERDEWRHPGPIGSLLEVLNLLESSPALKQVTLTPHFLCFGEFLHQFQDLPPFISLAPNILLLQLLLPFEHEETKEVINTKIDSWHDAFSHKHWFGFKPENNAALTIRVVVQTDSSVDVGIVKAMIERRLIEFEGETLGIDFAVSWEKKEEGLRAAGFFS